MMKFYLIGLGVYCLFTFFVYWQFVLRNFAPSTVKTVNIIARVALLAAPILIPLALVRGVLHLIFSKKEKENV